MRGGRNFAGEVAMVSDPLTFVVLGAVVADCVP
jgi:hypothetical protein